MSSPPPPILPPSSTSSPPHPAPSSAPNPTPPFPFPRIHSLPPFWSIQPTLSTRADQFRQWSSLILAYHRHHRQHRLVLVDALASPLFYHARLRRGLSLAEARLVLDWMAGEEGGRRVEWVVGWGGGGGGGGGGGMGTGMGTGKEEEKLACWVYWRRPEEWAEVVAGWVEETGQRGVVLTLWELREGEGTVGREFHGMDAELLQKVLQVLVKRGKAQVFGSDDQLGVKFF